MKGRWADATAGAGRRCPPASMSPGLRCAAASSFTYAKRPPGHGGALLLTAKSATANPTPQGTITHKKAGPPGAGLLDPERWNAPERMDQAAASLSFLSGRTLTLTEAGLAANHCSSLVKGLMPLRRGLAGTFCEVILSMPGRVNEPTPRLLSEPAMVSSSEASTARTSLAATPLV